MDKHLKYNELESDTGIKLTFIAFILKRLQFCDFRVTHDITLN